MADLNADLDRSYLDDETRAAAIRYLIESGNADVIALGLAMEDPPEGAVLVDGRLHCAACRYPMPKAGVCRRMRACRIEEGDVL